MDRKELEIRFSLVESQQWKAIRERALTRIVQYSNGNVEPLMIQGMLKLISDVDEWKIDFEKQLDRDKKN